MRVSIRSLLAAGLSLTAVSTSIPWAAQSAVTASAAPAIRLTAAASPLLPSVEAAAVTEYDTPTAFDELVVEPTIGGFTSAGDFIINAYNAIEPWVAWGFELVQWGMSFVPILWWVAPGVDLAYFSIEPIVQSLVYSFAYLIDGNTSLIGPTIQAGLQEAAYNFVQYSIYWFESIIPFPPLPPWPPFPFAAAATAGPAAVTRAAATVAVETADTVVAADSTSDADATTAEVSPETEGDTAVTATEADTQPESAETQAEVTETADMTETAGVTETAGAASLTAPRAGKRTAVRAALEASAEPAAPAAAAGSSEAPSPTAEQDQASTGRSGGKSGASTARSGR